MIKKITIKNFAIIDFMETDFSSGFNIITGETGSGKSLIINAIDILLGAKLDRQMLRTENNPLEISGIFNLKGSNIDVSRVYKSGKSSSYINGEKVSRTDLIKLSQSLVQFQKQHDSNKLLNSK